MKIRLPVEIDWEMAEEMFPGRSMSEISRQVDRAVRSVIVSPGLGEVISVGLSSGETSHMQTNFTPDLYEAGKLWKCHNDEVLKRLLAESITRSVDACLRAIGIGGVEGYAPSWTRFYREGQDDCTDDRPGEVLEHSVAESALTPIVESQPIIESKAEFPYHIGLWEMADGYLVGVHRGARVTDGVKYTNEEWRAAADDIRQRSMEHDVRLCCRGCQGLMWEYMLGEALMCPECMNQKWSRQ